MSKIRILPEHLANQIAAGEVVERPASVVKELVENSLDAGATRIEIEIEGGGTRLIRIIDDGEGMQEDDLLMSLERHGTSKITTQEDLGAIRTLGFRGEAVPSIGSVSKLTLTSRQKSKELGTRVVLDYGKLTKVHETGCSTGTTVEVRNLFGNTPARRKFLRTTRTEVGHIEDVVKNYALGRPDVTFIFRLNGKDTLYLDSTLSLEQRFASMIKYTGSFITVDQNETGPGKKIVSGFIVPPEKVTVGPARLRLFVNGRAVRDRLVTHAVSEGLRGFLMKGKNPSGLIHLDLPPEEVDVNVHPAKHEVRFRNSQDVHAFLSTSIARAIGNHQGTLKASIFGEGATPQRVPVEADTSPFSGGASHPQSVEEYGMLSRSQKTESPGLDANSRPVEYPSDFLQAESSPAPQSIKAPPLGTAERNKNDYSIEPQVVKPPKTDTARSSGHNLLVLGQFDELYIFCRSNEGLVVIDQHAAHERLLYEKFKNQYQENSIVRQTLMFPETVELSLFQSQLAEKNMEAIDKMGFSIREFGGNTFIISAVPALAGTINARELFLDILEQFGSERSSTRHANILDNILAGMACKAAVKAGTALSMPEIDKLLNEMARADLFSHCPHGRPVVKNFTADEIKKWFYRT
jgi:DNA mismatch repair protein MutL